MISYIKGNITYRNKDESFIVLECNGIGYKIFVAATTLSALDKVENGHIYTFMNVKEDGITLFGFLTQEEQQLFHQLLAVSGVGPKAALAFLSEMTPKEIIFAILSEDVKTLSKVPGVGKKTSQRLILELKDKVKAEELTEIGIIAQEQTQEDGNIKWEAIEGLTSLGYSKSEAAQVVNACYQQGISVEELLKLSLKKMIKF